MGGQNSSQRPKRLLICGTRSFAIDVADLVSELPEFELAGFVENMDPERCKQPLDGKPVYWIDELRSMADNHVAVCALATTHRGRFTAEVEAHGMPFATLVHPRAFVSRRATLGEGCIINAGVNIAAETRLGRHVLINRGAQIGHHIEIGDFSSIMPGVCLSGNSRVGQATYIGVGAVLIDNLKIGSHSVIGAGAVVTKDVPDHVQVVGVPARIVKENITGK